MRIGVRLAGAGGHGLVTASVVLADGAARAGKNVCQTQSYGPEARGGAAHADILISDDAILHPKVLLADLLVVLTQEASDTYATEVSEGCRVIADSGVVVGAGGAKVFTLPLLETARETFGGEAYAGILAVGAASLFLETVDPEGLSAAIAARLPRPTVETNLRAFAVGRALAGEALAAPALEPYEADM